MTNRPVLWSTYYRLFELFIANVRNTGQTLEIVDYSQKIISEMLIRFVADAREWHDVILG